LLHGKVRKLNSVVKSEQKDNLVFICLITNKIYFGQE